MELGEMGLNAPKIGGRGMASSKMPTSKPMSSRPTSGTSSISSATTGGGAPPVKNLGAKIIGALRARRRGMGAPRSGRRM